MTACPICKENHKQLNMHLFYKHGMKLEEFKRRYGEDYPLRDNGSYPCPYCSEIFVGPGNRGHHIRRKHPEHATQKQTKAIKEKFKCQICSGQYTNLSQHVEITHGMSWHQYCEQYNWDISKTRFVDDAYRKTLSENKKAFYKTEEGKEWLKDNSERYKGSNNPACKPEVRKKISEGRIKLYAEGKLNHCKTLAQSIAIKWGRGHKSFSRSYGIWFSHDGVEYKCRSLEEFKILSLLIEQKISFEYEPFKITWIDSSGFDHKYLVDLKIGNMLYEIKSSLNMKKLNEGEQLKYEAIRTTIQSSQYQYEFITYKSMCEKLGIQYDSGVDTLELIKRYISNGKITKFLYPKKKCYEAFLSRVDENFKTNPLFVRQGDLQNEMVKDTIS